MTGPIPRPERTLTTGVGDFPEIGTPFAGPGAFSPDRRKGDRARNLRKVRGELGSALGRKILPYQGLKVWRCGESRANPSLIPFLLNRENTGNFLEFSRFSRDWGRINIAYQYVSREFPIHWNREFYRGTGNCFRGSGNLFFPPKPVNRQGMFESRTQHSPQAIPEIKVPMRQRGFRPSDLVSGILCAGAALPFRNQRTVHRISAAEAQRVTLRDLVVEPPNGSGAPVA